MFRKNEHVYGSELSGELLGPLSWSLSGIYIAAAIANVVNIWHISGTFLTLVYYILHTNMTAYQTS